MQSHISQYMDMYMYMYMCMYRESVGSQVQVKVRAFSHLKRSNHHSYSYFVFISSDKNAHICNVCTAVCLCFVTLILISFIHLDTYSVQGGRGTTFGLFISSFMVHIFHLSIDIRRRSGSMLPKTHTCGALNHHSLYV